MTMKKIKTSIEIAEEQAAIKAYKQKYREQLLGNKVCSACGGTGVDEYEWVCGTCDGFGQVYLET